MDILDEQQIDTLEEFDVLMSPRRLQLAEHFIEPATVKSASEKLGVPVTRLYYHINLLVDHGFLRVVEERKAGAMVERLFQTTARSYRPSPEFLDRYGTEGLLEVIHLTFVEAEQDLRSAVHEGLVSLQEQDRERVVVSYVSKRISEERLREMVEAINRIVLDADDDPDGVLVRGLFTLFPKAGQ